MRATNTSRRPPAAPAFTFFGGKGGVGKTTCAAAWAVAAARRGPTLLVTTDPAPSLTAVLGTPVGSAPAPVAAAPNLFAASIDAAAAFRRWLAPRRALLATIALRGTYLDAEDVERILRLSLPGIDEVIGLIEVAELARRDGGRFAAVVVDTAPTGHTLRLLAAPSLVSRIAAVLDLLQAHHRDVVQALRGSYQADAADALIVDLDRQARDLSALLRDPAATTLHWVTLPEPMALEETADALAALASASIPVPHLLINRLTPAPRRRCGWCEARRRFESRALAPFRRRFPTATATAVPDLSAEPVGIRALRAAYARWGPWLPAARAAAPARRHRARLDRAAGGKLADIAGGARWLLFGGKGGVGKTTCAAAAAAGPAQSRRVLLLSTDPAHSLADVFGAAVDDTPRAIAGAPARLRVREIDAAARMRRFRATYVDAVDAAFAGLARSSGDRAAFRDLIDLAPPGLDEVIAIAEVAEALAAGRTGYDVIVTDSAPTGHVLRLLQTPALLREWTQAVMTILLKYRDVVHASDLAALLVQMSKRLRGLQDQLADAAHTRFIIVGRAAVLPRCESEDLARALRALGISVGAAVVNALGAGTCPRCVGTERRQRAELRAYVRAARGRYAIIEAPAEIPPPHGARGLIEWRQTWRAPA